MKNINKKTGILVGTGVILSIGAFIGAMVRRKKSKVMDDVFGMEDENLESKDELDFLVAEYLKEEEKSEEEKSEEEKQEEFRELSVKVMDLLLREVITIGGVVKKMEKEISKQNEYRELMEELEHSQDEIISLWEHLEALSNRREEYISDKGRG